MLPDPFEGINLDAPRPPPEALPGDQSMAAQLSIDGLPNVIQRVPLQPVIERRAAAYITAVFAALHPGEQIRALSHMKRFATTTVHNFQPFYIKDLENLLGFGRHLKLELVCRGYTSLSHVTKTKVFEDCAAMAADDASVIARYCQATQYQQLTSANAIALYLSEATFLASIMKMEPLTDDLFKMVHPDHLLLEWLRVEDKACEPWKDTLMQPREREIVGICAQMEPSHLNFPQYVEVTAQFSKLLQLGTPPASQPLELLSGPQPASIIKLPAHVQLPVENRLQAMFDGAVIQPLLVPAGGLPARYDPAVVPHLPEEELPPTNREVVDIGTRPRVQSAPPPTIAPIQALADVFQDVSNIYEPADEESPKEAPEMLGPTLRRLL